MREQGTNHQLPHPIVSATTINHPSMRLPSAPLASLLSRPKKIVIRKSTILIPQASTVSQGWMARGRQSRESRIRISDLRRSRYSNLDLVWGSLFVLPPYPVAVTSSVCGPAGCEARPGSNFGFDFCRLRGSCVPGLGWNLAVVRYLRTHSRFWMVYSYCIIQSRGFYCGLQGSPSNEAGVWDYRLWKCVLTE